MLIPRLPRPFLSQDILSIPDMMRHSPLFHHDHGLKKKKKKKYLIPPLGFSLIGAEKTACSLGKDEETNVLLIAMWSHWLCLVPIGSSFHLVLFKAVCCGEPVTVFIPERETFHVQYLLSSDFDSRLWSVLRLFVLPLLPFAWHPCQARLASFSVCKPLDHLW